MANIDELLKAKQNIKASDLAKLEKYLAEEQAKKFTMRPTYEGTIPPEQSLTRYVPGKGIVPIEPSARVTPKAEIAGTKNFYTSQGDNLAEFGKNVPKPAVTTTDIVPIKGTQTARSSGAIREGAGARSYYTSQGDPMTEFGRNVPGSRTQLPAVYDPLAQGIQGKAPSILQQLKGIGGKALSALGKVSTPITVGSAVATIQEKEQMHPAAIAEQQRQNLLMGLPDEGMPYEPTQINTNVNTPIAKTTPAFSKDFNVDGLELGLPKRNLMDFNIDNPFKTNQQNTEVQSPIIKADTNNIDTSHNDFMQRYLEQAANNSIGMQGMNSANSATAYNNMLEAGIARGANSRSKRSYIPHYEKAVAYSPQAMNFGSNQQPTSVSFGNTSNNSTLGRVGNINGLNLYDANGQLKSFNKQEIVDAGKAMEGKFIGADNQLHAKSVMGGFTANNSNNKQLENLAYNNAPPIVPKDLNTPIQALMSHLRNQQRDQNPNNYLMRF